MLKKTTQLFLVGLSLFVISIISVLFLYKSKARANEYLLYPSTCLGGWENPQLAEGAPQVSLESREASIFTEENSARLKGNIAAQMYCGGFKEDIPEDVIPKNIVVKFSWTVGYVEPSIEIPPTDSDIPAVPNQQSVKENDTKEDIQIEDLDKNLEDKNLPVNEDNILELEQPQIPQEVSVPESASISFFKLFTKVAYGQETSVNEIKRLDSYGLVEVLYTLDGVDWKSLGFVDKDSFDNTQFKIPIEEVATWEDVSKIQISVRSVPILDGTTPVIYLDSMWIEAGYEHLNKNETNTTITDTTDNLGQMNKEIPQTKEETTNVEDFQIEELSKDVSLLETEDKNSLKETVVNLNAVHRCNVSPFSLNVYENHNLNTNILLTKILSGNYELKIGERPQGIDVKFAENDNYIYNPKPDENTVSISVLNTIGSVRGNFSVPIIFTEKNTNSSFICQINIVN